MKNLNTAKRLIIKEMHNNGTMSKIDLRIAKHNEKAVSMGFKNAQDAFKSLGKDFLTIANA